MTKPGLAEPLMRKTMVVAIAASIGLIASVAEGDAAQKFQKLTGSQIRAKFIGMEMTDNIHFADVFGANGGLNPLYQVGGPRSIQLALKLQF